MSSSLARLTPIVMSAVLLGCGRTVAPTDPGTIPSGLAQTEAWSIELEVTACSNDSYWCHVGDTEEFALRIAPDGEGLAQITPMPAGQRFSVDLAGVLGSDGTWTASGSLRIPTRSEVDAQVAVSGINGDALTGTLTYELNHGLGPQTRTARIVSSRRLEAMRPAPFEGRWSGWVERTSCTGTCQDDTLFGYLVDFEMEVSQAVSALSGTIERVGPFSAVAQGTALTLSVSHGRADDPGCLPAYYGRTCFVEISNMAVTLDKLDRMHGTFSYRVQGYTDTGSPYASVAGTARLVGVARWE